MTDEVLIAEAQIIVNAGKQIKESIHETLSKPFSIYQIYEILVGLVRAAEAIFQGTGQGMIKHKLVREVWHRLDKEYGLVDKMDAAIKLPIWLEPFDATIIRASIDGLIILIVTALNSTGVFKRP